MSNKDDTHLQGAFGEKSEKKNYIDYSHPMAKEFEKELISKLSRIKTGYTLLAVPEDYKYSIRILKGKAEPGTSSEHKIVYIHIPIKQTEVLPKQILDLTKALRLAEQDIMGFTTPDPSKDLFEYASVVHAKNLDAIVYMCKLVKDLEGTDKYSVFLDTLEKMGHSAVYKTYVSDFTDESLNDAYHNK